MIVSDNYATCRLIYIIIPIIVIIILGIILFLSKSKRAKIILSILIPLIILLGAVNIVLCDYWHEQWVNETIKSEYEYKISIMTCQSGNYELYVPIMINFSNEPIPLMNNLQTDDNIGYEIKMTSFGYALYILFQNSFNLSSRINFGSNSNINRIDYDYSLSMEANNSSRSYYYVYFNSTISDSVFLTFYSYSHTSSFYSGSSNIYRVDLYSLPIGWYSAKFEHYNMHYD
jgi:hypothetical protein